MTLPVGLRLAVSAAFILVGLDVPTQAAVPEPLSNDYVVQHWTVDDGAPDAPVYQIAQDRQGYLWLATQAGLYRFDGTRFLPWISLSVQPLPAGPVQAVHIARDESLWVGTGGSRGGVSVVKADRVRVYSERDGLPSSAVISIVEDTTGRVWVGNDVGVFYLDGEHWKEWRSPDFTGVGIWVLRVDSNGDLLAGGPAGVFRKPHGSTGFDTVVRFADSPPVRLGNAPSILGFAPETFLRALASDSAGRLFANDRRSGYRVIGEPQPAQTQRRGRGSSVMFDKHGALWVATSNQGVWRVEQPWSSKPVMQSDPVPMGLGSLGAASLFEDRDGNVWAGGTPNGLTRFTPQKFQRLMRDVIVRALAIRPDGHVWVGTSDGLFDIADPVGKPSMMRRHLVGESIRALHVDRRGSTWVATQRQLFEHSPESVGPRPVDNGQALRQVDSVTSGFNGEVVISDAERGLLRWTRAAGFESIQLPVEVQRDRIMTTYSDSRGTFWITFATGRIARLDQSGTPTVYNRQPQTDDVYRIVHEDARAVVWLGGTNGIMRYSEEDGQFVALRADGRLPLRDLRAIAHDQSGYLWIATARGILRVHASEIDRAVKTSTYQPVHEFYDASDGFAALSPLVSDNPAIRLPDDAYWFVAGEGITVIDPRLLQANAPPPVVSIDSVAVDDRPLSPARDIDLPAGTIRLQVEYSALNLTSPKKTRFRFRLDGVDSDWVDAGARRQASYTNLAPGAYRFRVSASNALGIWTDAGSTWQFSVAPHFYQTRWFAALCAASLLLVAWGGWSFRLRQERMRFSMVLGERVRVSREIHDTLLQGLVGVGLQCDALAATLAGTAPDAADRFLRLRDQTNQYIKDARATIAKLRTSAFKREELPEALRLLHKAVSATGVEFVMTVNGSSRALEHEVEEQLVRIASEAVTNAVRHARAKRIHVELEYGREGVMLRVSDDGCGFPQEVFVASDLHFGLAGMRERAESIRATFRIDSEIGRGTRIEIGVLGGQRPAAIETV